MQFGAWPTSSVECLCENEIKNNCCLFEKLFKVKKNGIWNTLIFFVLEIFRFFIMQIKKYLQKYSQSVLQSWHLKCTLQKKQNDSYYVVAMATILAPVSFCEKPNISICNLFKWDRGSSSEHTWFPYCLNSLHKIVASG